MVRSVYGVMEQKPVAKRTATTKKTATAAPKKTVSAKPKQDNIKPTVVLPTSNKRTDSRPRVAMFIDVDNANVSRENLLEILFYLGGKYKIEICKLYGYNEEALPGIKEVANDYNLVTVGKTPFAPLGQRYLDARVLVDAYECALKNALSLDTVFVWCFPCDLANVFEKITELGVSTATIDHPAFDCKNKFVSQTIKLYSKYDFSMSEPMFNQIKTATARPEPDLVLDDEPVEPAIPAPQISELPPLPEKVPEPQAQPLPTPAAPINEPAPIPEASAEPQSNLTEQDLETLDGLPIPVLPKREIPERSVKKPEATTPDVNAEADKTPTIKPAFAFNPNETLADVISREFKTPEENTTAIPELNPDGEAAPALDDESIYDIMKKVGLMDNGEKKEVKYEDTIGDLWYNALLCEKCLIMNYEKCGLIFIKITRMR